MSTPEDFTVRLEDVFQGPLDLLLHLVREQEVEIQDVEISRVIDGYLAHLDALSELDVELAGDFLVMAATLMSIKSRSLLPREEIDLEDELDPKDELIQRLIEYRRFKEAAGDLGARWEERRRLHGRGSHPEVEGHEPEVTLALGELTPWDLLAVFSRLLRETLAGQPRTVRGEPRPLRYYVRELATRMRSSGRASLRELVSALDDGVTRESLVGAFCALLELVKLGVVRVHQARDGDEVDVTLSEEASLDLEALLDATRFFDEAGDEAENESEEEGPSRPPEGGGDAGDPLPPDGEPGRDAHRGA